MTKINSAIIRLSLRLNKTLSNGMHPIMLVVQFNGRKEKSTGYSCTESDWDSKNEVIKNKKFSNYAQINKAITDFKQKIISRKLDFEINLQKYTAEMLLKDEDRNFCGNTLVFYDLMMSMVSNMGLKYNTVKGYIVLYKSLAKYMKGEKFLITKLDTEFCKSYSKYLMDNGVKDGTIRTFLSKIASVFNYYIDSGLIEANLYPFRTFKYCNSYSKSMNKKAISTQCMIAIHSYYYDLCYTNYLEPTKYQIEFSFGHVDYKNGAFNRLQKRYTMECSLATFLFGWLAQGLALIDIAKLKSSDISIEHYKVEGNDIIAYYFKTVRTKTRKEVKVYIESDDLAKSVIEPFLKTADMRGGYLFPILQDDEYEYNYDTDKKISIALNTTAKMINENLRRMVPIVNSTMKEHARKIGKEQTEQLPANLSFYAMRHSFATSYIAKGGDPVKLATMMGRSPSGIFSYVKELTTAEDIIKEKKDMY